MTIRLLPTALQMLRLRFMTRRWKRVAHKVVILKNDDPLLIEELKVLYHQS